MQKSQIKCLNQLGIVLDELKEEELNPPMLLMLWSSRFVLWTWRIDSAAAAAQSIADSGHIFCTSEEQLRSTVYSCSDYCRLLSSD